MKSTVLLCFAASTFNQGLCAMIKKVLLDVSSIQLPDKVAVQIDKVKILAMVRRRVLSGSRKKNERNCDSTRSLGI